VPDRLDPPLEDLDHVLGPAEAPLELVMYGDFQCPYCLAAQSILRRVRDRLDGRLRYAFRHLPIADKHPMARASAEASEAAAAQGAFWEYHDALYTAQSRLSDRELVVIAEDLGLDAGRLEREVREGRWAGRVERDLASALRGGAQGTPTFFVNGVRYADVYDAGSLVAALESSAPA
jgi:Na+:H+ antiporter, NhaA family